MRHYMKCTWTRRDGRRCWAPGHYDVHGVAVCEWHLRAAQAEYARSGRAIPPSWFRVLHPPTVKEARPY